jgi:hypothetical protein
VRREKIKSKEIYERKNNWILYRGRKRNEKSYVAPKG